MRCCKIGNLLHRIRIIAALAAHEGRPVDDFLRDARAAMSLPGKKSKGSSFLPMGGTKPAPPEPKELVQKYALKLAAAGTDESAFNAAFSALEKEKSAVKEIVFAIANEYVNEPSSAAHQFKFKTKKLALEAIRNAFAYRAQSRLRAGEIDR